MSQEKHPTEIRLSEHFLLSDLMGCHSVYAKGFRNVFASAGLIQSAKMAEGKTLARKLLEPLLERSRLSVTYGYISPELSRKIVKYQDPDKPSYHRWDAGAACDVVLHQYVNAGIPPIYAACWVDDHLPVSRTITYSESPAICVSTRMTEVDKNNPRRALYENRYVGDRKPQYIRYSDNEKARLEQKANIELKHDWRGEGHPTYHGGGIKQAQHYRTSKYTLLSDFLMSEEAMREGYANMPPSLTSRGLVRFRRAGAVIDTLLQETKARRLSIVQAYQSEDWKGDAPSNWKDGAYLVLVPPVGLEPDTLAHEASQIGCVSKVGVAKNGRVWLVMLDKDAHEGTKKVQVAGDEETEGTHVAERRRTRVRSAR